MAIPSTVNINALMINASLFIADQMTEWMNVFPLIYTWESFPLCTSIASVYD